MSRFEANWPIDIVFGFGIAFVRHALC